MGADETANWEWVFPDGRPPVPIGNKTYNAAHALPVPEGAVLNEVNARGQTITQNAGAADAFVPAGTREALLTNIAEELPSAQRRYSQIQTISKFLTDPNAFFGSGQRAITTLSAAAQTLAGVEITSTDPIQAAKQLTNALATDKAKLLAPVSDSDFDRLMERYFDPSISRRANKITLQLALAEEQVQIAQLQAEEQFLHSGPKDADGQPLSTDAMYFGAKQAGRQARERALQRAETLATQLVTTLGGKITDRDNLRDILLGGEVAEPEPTGSGYAIRSSEIDEKDLPDRARRIVTGEDGVEWVEKPTAQGWQKTDEDPEAIRFIGAGR
jgi:hypothetical protein